MPAKQSRAVHSGDVIRVEFDGAKELLPTRMEFRYGQREYYSIDGYRLVDGLRAAVGVWD